LPLISYGGSSVLTTAIGIGLLMNISMRRFMIE
jgi:rod shape determining protein RodA